MENNTGEKRASKIGLIVSLVLAALLIGGAILWARSSADSNSGLDSNASSEENKPETTTTDEESNSTEETGGVITQAELAAANGKDGNKCYVAVSDKVYEVKDSALWQNGQHTTSNGQAFCGADMTEAIKASPHGKSKLEQLPEVGRLQ